MSLNYIISGLLGQGLEITLYRAWQTMLRVGGSGRRVSLY